MSVKVPGLAYEFSDGIMRNKPVSNARIKHLRIEAGYGGRHTCKRYLYSIYAMGDHKQFLSTFIVNIMVLTKTCLSMCSVNLCFGNVSTSRQPSELSAHVFQGAQYIFMS